MPCPPGFDIESRVLTCEGAVTAGGEAKGEREEEQGRRNEGFRGKKCDIRLQASQLGNGVPAGGVLGLGWQLHTLVGTIRQGRRSTLEWGPIRTRAQRIRAITSVARLMHKTSIRVVDGNGWRRNSYARRVSLVGGPGWGYAFFGQGGGRVVGAGHLETENPLSDSEERQIERESEQTVQRRTKTGRRDGGKGCNCRTVIDGSSRPWIARDGIPRPGQKDRIRRY